LIEDGLELMEENPFGDGVSLAKRTDYIWRRETTDCSEEGSLKPGKASTVNGNYPAGLADAATSASALMGGAKTKQ
jgi:hypothetical protein